MATTPEGDTILGYAWCPECRRRQPIIDQYQEDTGDSRRTVEVYAVEDLACGHQTSRQIGEYRSPLQQAGPTRAMVLAKRDPWADQ